MTRAWSLSLLLMLFAAGPAAAGEPEWVQVNSAHFTVLSNDGDRVARSVAWRFEQARSAVAIICPWAIVDVGKPTVVIGARDEATMKALVPSYWEEKKSLHPDAVWFEGPNRYYILVRTDRRDESETDPTVPQNPYQMAYFAYIHVILQASFPGTLPPWFSRGFSAVLSNTIVQDHAIVVGSPMLMHLNRLRERQPLALGPLLGMPADDPTLRQQDPLLTFDASAWAFVHYLLFADNGARRARIDALARALQRGERPDAAVEASLGSVAALQPDYGRYVGRSIFQYQKTAVDAAVKTEALPAKKLAPAETMAMRATVHAVMRRPAEAQREIADARRLDPNLAASHFAEALLHDAAGETEPARLAYEQAIAHEIDDAYAYYRGAVLNWPSDANPETLTRIDGWLSTAIARNNRYAVAYAALGQVRALRSHAAEQSVPLALRAVALEPNATEPHRAVGATYLILGDLEKARAEARTAAALARSDSEQRSAAQLVSEIDREQSYLTARAAQEKASAAAAAEASDIQAKVTACNGGTAEACAGLVPFLQSRCAQKDAGACGMLGWLYQGGHGVAADAAQAATYYRQSCDAGDQRACQAFALMLSRGQGVPKDVAAALEMLDKGCSGGLPQACTQEAVVLASRQRATDRVRIRTLLDAGCKGGDTAACDMRKSMPR